MSVTLAMPYLFTGFARYSVDHGISRGARKLARTPTLIKKKIHERGPLNHITPFFFCQDYTKYQMKLIHKSYLKSES